MATDQSPPRTRLIVTLTIVTVASLGILKPIFDSYFTDMFESEAKAKIPAPEELRKQRQEEDLKLVGIDKAMGDLAHGREGSALIAPTQSNDTASLVGWSRLAAEGGVAPTFDNAPTAGGALMMGPSDASVDSPGARGDARAPQHSGDAAP